MGLKLKLPGIALGKKAAKKLGGGTTTPGIALGEKILTDTKIAAGDVVAGGGVAPLVVTEGLDAQAAAKKKDQQRRDAEAAAAATEAARAAGLEARRKPLRLRGQRFPICSCWSGQ